MKASIEEVIIKTNRSTRRPWQSRIIIGSFVLVGFCFWKIPGALIAIVVAVLIVMGLNSIRGMRVWNLCERDYAQLISGGYSEDQALIVISKSFCPQLSDYFYERVINKFPSLNEVVVFFTGALPENAQDEEWALKCLEKTSIERSPSVPYKARTKW